MLLTRPVLCILLACGSIMPAQAGMGTKYVPAGLLGGYKDKLIGPDTWEVMARTNGYADEDAAQVMVMYRAAEVASTAGLTHMQIIDQKGYKTMAGYGSPTSYAGSKITIKVRGTNDEKASIECAAAKKEVCFTANTATTMQMLRPRLNLPKSLRDQSTISSGVKK